jgi:hypothetical protein
MDDTTRAEREDILNACVGFAQRMLDEYGEFYPFGVSLGDDGLTMDPMWEDPEGSEGVAGPTGEVEVPDEEVPVVVDRIVARHRASAARGELRGCGTTLDVLLTDPDGVEHDAICVDVEHRDGEPVRALLPYDRAEDGSFNYGELVALRLEPEIFAVD